MMYFVGCKEVTVKESIPTRDEYRRMFDCALYDSVRQKYQAEGVFMDTYDKVKRPA